MILAALMAIPGFWDGFTAIAVFGLIGAAIKWLWDSVNARIDKKTADLDAREKAIEDQTNARVSVLEHQVNTLLESQKTLIDVVSRQRTAIHLLIAKILKDDPTAVEIEMVKNLLRDEFPLDMATGALSRESAVLTTLSQKIDECIGDGACDNGA